MRNLTALLLLPLSIACSATYDTGQTELEARSLSGEPLYRIDLPEEVETRRLQELEEAKLSLTRNPDDPDALIWVGRRTAYLGRYRDSIELFSRGVRQFPGDARFLRHRGHRYISIRDLDRAIDDLTTAAAIIEGEPDEIEPDGLPNARGIPTSTLQSNIWYHLGLAHYLSGEFQSALGAYRRGMEVSKNPDGLVSMSYWLYMTLRRLGREEQAVEVLEPITADLDVIENQAYHQLLLLNKGELTLDDILAEAGDGLQNATIGYGVGNWHLYNGRPEAAKKVFREVIASGEWPAFGFIAAEAELARMATND